MINAKVYSLLKLFCFNNKKITYIKTLKKGTLGKVHIIRVGNKKYVLKDISQVAFLFKPIAKFLKNNEEKSLLKVEEAFRNKNIDFPKLIYRNKLFNVKIYLEGEPLKKNMINDVTPQYFIRAEKIMNELHEMGIVHNDNQKKENWLINKKGHPCLIDYDIALSFKKYNQLFKYLKKQDIRHFLKLKSKFFPDLITNKQKQMIDKRNLLYWINRHFIKPIYKNFVSILFFIITFSKIKNLSSKLRINTFSLRNEKRKNC
ncbi:hypothetical protein CF386_08495 [Paraphotobacterium marinum]|uniref:Protein kinase domain-containing protein n=1 Tax=Paraphotobacterium marinum TaxID=1755811 RepID=A0A220VFI2_9GAMM|nr:hypothetical protein [Paraphotobacterium marinum]ASK79099.1 hypothetical protein CF386_08495 [Paraphotobacterium marinum]